MNLKKQLNVPAPSLRDLMTVTPTGQQDRYVGQGEDYGELGVYGGHLIGQALAAGLMTVEPAKPAHSLHAYFLNPGLPNEEIEYQVTRLREGRRSVVRNILATQSGIAILTMTASFKNAEEGDQHQPDAPGVPTPQELKLEREARGEPTKRTSIFKDGRAESEFATRSFFEFDPERDAKIQQWIRACDSELTAREAQAVLAFFSDGTLMFNSAIPHGVPMQSHRLTSLDHSV